MKLFKQLLVAPPPRACWLPWLPVQLKSTLPVLPTTPLSSKGSSLEQVTSITQFSDVDPTDWAHQALSNLIERYGCVAGYPNGTYRGNRAMTRFEAAALLNACLDRVTEVTDELKRLMKEFEKELAIVKGRGGRSGSPRGRAGSNPVLHHHQALWLGDFGCRSESFYGFRDPLRAESNAEFGGTVFNYDLQLALETSFTGKDLLTTVLRSGNFDGDDNVFGSGGRRVWPPWIPRSRRVINRINWRSTSSSIPSPLGSPSPSPRVPTSGRKTCSRSGRACIPVIRFSRY